MKEGGASQTSPSNKEEISLGLGERKDEGEIMGTETLVVCGGTSLPSRQSPKKPS